MRPGRNPNERSQGIYRLAVFLALVWGALYIVIYWYQPFSEYWNNFLSNFFVQAASLVAAVFASMVWMRYDKLDPPRRIWSSFAIALWLWFAGEVTWGYLNMTVSEVPIGLPDLFWISSYVFFGLALVHQYRILVQPDSRTMRIQVVSAFLMLLILTLVISRVISSFVDMPKLLDTVVYSFYPAADLLLAMIALWLVHKFMGGAFSRPWLGLLVFAFCDLMYAWLESSGLYAWSLEQGNLLTTIADVAYLGAYLVLGIAVLSQWLFLEYGLRAHEDAR